MQSVVEPPTPRRNMPLLLVVGFTVAVISYFALAFLVGTPKITNSSPTNAQAVARGEGIYAANCASCHGANLEGAPNWQTPLGDGTMPAPPHDASGHTWHHNDESLFTTVKFGGQATSPPGYVNRMPPFGSVLSDEEIYAVLAYIKSTWPAELQEAQQRGHQ